VSTFINARLDLDGRLRCSFNPCGTYTFRYSSSKNAFWNGTNLQNIPKGVEAKEPEDLELPNIRKLFIPDPGFTFFDMDLDRADAQVVAWEADDSELKAILREGADLHAENAKALGISRQLAKSWVHGTNYGGGPRTMAVTCGLTVHHAEKMQQRWFQAHPGIKRWHDRTLAQCNTKGYVSNVFGYRWYLFDRLNLPDALAWQPQSVVGRVINTAWQRIHNEAPYIQILLQVHDSLAGQFPTHLKPQALEVLRSLATVTIPYSDPLVIPVGIKTSEVSWGACV
jgi:DNA polymerase-1